MENGHRVKRDYWQSAVTISLIDVGCGQSEIKFNTPDNLDLSLTTNDYKATDWAVVRDKIETLSDKVIRISFVNPNIDDGVMIDEGCKLSDIQQLIIDIKDNINGEWSGLQGVIDIIDKCAGERFK